MPDTARTAVPEGLRGTKTPIRHLTGPTAPSPTSSRQCTAPKRDTGSAPAGLDLRDGSSRRPIESHQDPRPGRHRFGVELLSGRVALRSARCLGVSPNGEPTP
jgi:hypothetical protein